MNCIKCGNELAERDQFCSQCGKRTGAVKNGKACQIYHSVMLMVYGITILTCFICNLATEGTLSWFFIVLSALALSFSITNIPVMVRKHKLITATICASVMVYVLLFVCNGYVKGDWLFRFAYPVATISMSFAWGIILICVLPRVNWLLKSAFISLIAGMATLTINPLCAALMNEPVNFYQTIRLDDWQPDLIGNKITFLCFTAYFVIGFVSGLFKKSAK